MFGANYILSRGIYREDEDDSKDMNGDDWNEGTTDYLLKVKVVKIRD